MAKVILVSLGEQDRLLVDGPSFLAARAGVDASAVIRLDRLAERALRPGDAALKTCLEGDTAYVIGCSRPRAVRALLAFAGVALRDEGVEWVALPFDRAALEREYGVPWYPVIDRSLCTGCGTCHDYCLFSVYAVADRAAAPAGRVRVTAPLNCKTGCPACARLCPEGALLFPFCPEAGLNGSVAQPEHRGADRIAAELGEDPMRLLAERRKRKRLIDPAKFDQAEKDRILYSGVL